MTRNVRTLSIVGLLLILTLVAAGCYVPPATPAPAEEPAEEEAAAEEAEPLADFGEGEHYVRNQVILTGRRQDVDNLAERAELEMVDENIITFKGLDFPPNPTPLRFNPEEFGELVMGLYQIAPDTRVPDEITRLYTIIVENNLNVYVDPNYLTEDSVEFDPWDPGGSPFSPAGGSSGEVVYRTQWALGQNNGIHLSDGTGQRLVTSCGEGTLVAIFDTSPFTDKGGKEFEVQEDEWPKLECGSSTSPHPLELTVSHPDLDKILLSPAKFPDTKNHGLFVVGLVHAVAPASEKHLIRVLNDEGHGTLFGLAKALVEFTKATLDGQPIKQQYLEKTVINLSLGLSEPDDPQDVFSSAELNELKYIQDQAEKLMDAMTGEEWARAKQALDAMTPSPEEIKGEIEGEKKKLPVVGLETPLAVAYGYGAVIVAAAGNDSYQPPAGDPKPAQKPASYPIPFVIGVASSNKGGSRSCFSNIGDIAAPSGEGDVGTFQGETLDCTPQLDKCTGDCEFAVVSLSLSSNSKPGYSYWTGTSFAAPLVSGQAALLLEAKVPPHDVAHVIAGTARASGAPGGVINLP